MADTVGPEILDGLPHILGPRPLPGVHNDCQASLPRPLKDWQEGVHRKCGLVACEVDTNDAPVHP